MGNYDFVSAAKKRVTGKTGNYDFVSAAKKRTSSRVNYDFTSAAKRGTDYSRNNAADKSNVLTHTISTKDGQTLGNISKKGYEAIENNKLDGYKPINDTEKKTIEAYKKYSQKEKVNKIDTELKKLYADKKKVDSYAKSKEYDKAKARYDSAARDGWAGTSKEEEKKFFDEAQKKFDYYTTIDSQIAVLENDKKILEVFNRYGLDMANFNYLDLMDWARKNNFEVAENPSLDNDDIKPKKEKGLFGKKITTKQEESDLETLKYYVQNKALEGFAEEHPWLATTTTIVSAPIRAVANIAATAEDVVNTASGKGINLMSPLKGMQTGTNIIRKVGSEKASEWFGGAEAPVIGNVGSWVYGAATSAGDSAMNMLAAGAIGGALGGSTNLVSGIMSGLTGSNVVQSEIISAKERGLSDGKALITGLASGAVETLTEKFSVDAILKKPATLGKKILRGFIAEGSEEMTAEVAGSVIDSLINQSDSKLSRAIQGYMNEEGLSIGEATTRAYKDLFTQTLSAGLAGGFSGMGMSGSYSAINSTYGASRLGEQLKTDMGADVIVEMASTFKDSTKTAKQVAELKKDIGTGNEISNRAVGSLYQTMMAETEELSIEERFKSPSEGINAVNYRLSNADASTKLWILGTAAKAEQALEGQGRTLKEVSNAAANLGNASRRAISSAFGNVNAGVSLYGANLEALSNPSGYRINARLYADVVAETIKKNDSTLYKELSGMSKDVGGLIFDAYTGKREVNGALRETVEKFATVMSSTVSNGMKIHAMVYSGGTGAEEFNFNFSDRPNAVSRGTAEIETDASEVDIDLVVDADKKMYDIMDELGLTKDEQYAILEYKNSRSYILNEALYSGRELTEEEEKLVESVNTALDRFDTYTGKVYRNLKFNSREELETFVKTHTEGDIVNYPAFVSASKVEDGYSVEGEFLANLEIYSATAKDVSNIGIIKEQEVLFKTNSAHEIKRVIFDGKTAKIILEENGYEEARRNDRTRQGYDIQHSEEHGGAVQLMQTPGTVGLQVQGISPRDSEGDNSRNAQSREAVSGGQRSSVRTKGIKTDREIEKRSLETMYNIPEGSEIVNNIVVDEHSKRLKRENLRAYSNIIRMAKRLGMNVRFVKNLTDENGKVLEGLITSKGIFINADAKNPSRFVATHEFGHRMKQAAPKVWAKYQEYVINKLKSESFDSGRTAYDVLYEETKNAYGKDDADYINEEIAVNYAGELFDSEEMLESFIREDKGLAIRVRDWWYNVLESMGLLNEKKKAQQLWLKAYTAAGKNVKDGKVGEYSGERYSKKEIREIFKEQVIDAIHNPNKIDGNNVLVGYTTSILKQLGLNDRLMCMTKGHVRDINTPEDGIHSEYHGLTEQEIYDMLPTILEYPAIVFDSISKQNPNAVCILSEKTTKSGLPVIVAINPDGKGRYNDVRIISNFVLSTYGRNNPIGYLNELSKNSGKVLYINEFRTKKLLEVIYDKNKRTKEEFKGARLQLPAGLNNLRFNYILHKSENVVKSNVQENNGRIRLEDRINGEELLNAIDTIKEIRDIGGRVDNYGYVTLFHATNNESARSIMDGKKMRAKEDGLFFSTKANGEIRGYGKSVLKFKIPVEMLEMNDVFHDEIHFRLPFKNKSESIDVSDYLIVPQNMQNTAENAQEEKKAYDIERIKRTTFPSRGSKAQAIKATEKSSSKGTAPQTLLAVVDDDMSPTVPTDATISQDNPTVNSNSMQNTEENAKEGKKSIVAEDKVGEYNEKRVSQMRNAEDEMQSEETDERIKKGFQKNSLIKKIQKNLEQLSKEDVILSLDTDIFNDRNMNIVEQVGAFFDLLGNKVYRADFGEVILNKDGIKSAIGHKMGRAKCIAFRAVPDIIKYGKQIDYQEKWKGRPYDSYVFAGKVKIGNEDAFVGVVVTRNKNTSEYYLHEIVDNEGNFISIKNDEVVPNKTVSKTDNSLHGGTTSSVDTTISQDNHSVNSHFMQNTAENAQEGKKSIAGTRLSELVEKYGAIPAGEKPAREVTVPKKIADDKPVSRFARTMMEAGVTPEFAISEFERRVLDGTLTHEVIANKNAKDYAERRIEELGFEGAVNRWSELTAEGKVDKKEFALGMELYNQAITNKDVKTAMKIAAELTAEATRAGQTLQACRMLKQMSPDGQLYYLEKSVQKMNDEFIDKLGKKFDGIKLDEGLMEEFLYAESEEARNAVYDKICQHIADQIPATKKDKWNSWRYLAMLGNPRTHIRNIAGNAVFVPAIRIKNYIGAVIEETSGIKTEDRTKSAKKTKKAVEFAKQDFEKMAKALQGENAKYAVTSDIDSKRRIFKTRWLEAIRRKNFDFLENEDMWFLKLHYTDALARIITARKIDIDTVDEKSLDMMRAYAIKEAQAATYRDANSLAEALNKIQRRAERSDSKISRLAGVMIEGVMPFKKTPMNIAKQGILYSPVGIMNGIYKKVMALKKGNVYSATEFVDDLAKGLTGTGVVLLGYFLASIGMLSGGADEDEKKKAFDKMTGEQIYAVNIGEKSYTIDWVTPGSLPLFVGEALYEISQGEEFGFREITESMSRLPEPLLELSVFSGINDLLETTRYSGENSLVAIGSDMATSYVLQALPTIGGQLSRIIDNTKRNYYYADKNKDAPDAIQRFVGQTAAKIPFASYLFEPTVDEWGRVDTYGSFIERGLENLVSPGYYSEEEYTAVDKEIARLYEKTGESKVLPTKQQKYFVQDKIRYNMSAADYTEVKIIRGKESFRLIKELISSGEYHEMSDEEKVNAIGKCYEKAGKYAKEKMFEKVKKASGK